MKDFGEGLGGEIQGTIEYIFFLVQKLIWGAQFLYLYVIFSCNQVLCCHFLKSSGGMNEGSG